MMTVRIEGATRRVARDKKWNIKERNDRPCSIGVSIISPSRCPGWTFPDCGEGYSVQLVEVHEVHPPMLLHHFVILTARDWRRVIGVWRGRFAGKSWRRCRVGGLRCGCFAAGTEDELRDWPISVTHQEPRPSFLPKTFPFLPFAPPSYHKEARALPFVPSFVSFFAEFLPARPTRHLSAHFLQKWQPPQTIPRLTIDA